MLVTPHWDEAFGNVVAESLACGTPVVTYDRGGPAELMEHGKTGFVVPYGDIDELALSLEKIDKIDRSYCRTYATEHFSMTALAERITNWSLS